jgi:hypothetical protein
MLNRIKKLARSGLTSTMVLGDFLKRRIAPLQQRSRMAYMYTGLNDCCRIARGPGGDFTRAELEAALRAMTGEAFSPESLVLPSGVKALCEDQSLRSSVLVSMPATGRRPQPRAPDLWCHTGPPATYQRRSRGAETRRSGPRREREGEGAGARAPAQGPLGGVEIPEAPAWRRLLGRGVGAQAQEDGGGGGAERSSTTSAPTPAAREETGGGAPASSEAADSSTATAVTAASYATATANRADAANPTPATRSTSSRRPSPEVRGVLDREEGPPSCPGQMGVV